MINYIDFKNYVIAEEIQVLDINIIESIQIESY